MLREDLKKIKNNENDCINYGEFYDLLSEIQSVIELSRNSAKNDIKCFCDLLEIKNEKDLRSKVVNKAEILNSNKREKLLHILSLMYTEKFYNHEYFHKIFGACYNLQIPGKFSFIKKPSNLEETNKMFDSLREILLDKNISSASMLVNQVSKRFSDVLATSAYLIFSTDANLEKCSKTIDGILKACDNNEIMKVDNVAEICNIINEQIIFPEDADEQLKNMNIGDYLSQFISGYNNAVIPTEYQEKLKRYYSYITNTKFNDLDNSELPNHDDPEFLKYMNDLEEMLQTDSSNVKQISKKMAIVSMHHHSYYRR